VRGHKFATPKSRMARNTLNKKCIHCLCIPEEITKDHAIPESWYSEKSKSEKKPTAPACLDCNNRLSSLEKRLLNVAGMCIPEAHPLKAELSAKAFRSFGLDPKGRPLEHLESTEKWARGRDLANLISRTEPAINFDAKSIIPGFGFHPGLPKEKQKAIRIKHEEIFPVIEKIIRGLEYVLGGCRYVELPYKLEVFIPSDPQTPNLVKLRETLPVIFDGTNKIQRGVESTKPLEPIYIVKLWDAIEIWGSISKDDSD